jgi:hypothetical protein
LRLSRDAPTVDAFDRVRLRWVFVAGVFIARGFGAGVAGRFVAFLADFFAASFTARAATVAFSPARVEAARLMSFLRACA